MSTKDVDLLLRTPQLHYLQFIARRDELSLSAAMGAIIASFSETVPLRPRAPARSEESLHLCLDPNCLDTLNMLMARWGVTRSEAGRRVIDHARGDIRFDAA